MDSSGSMQSSSGGDEEYESRADSITAAFITHHGGSLAGNFHHPPPQSSPMFDPLSNLFDPRPSIVNPNPNPLLNLDMSWSRAARSDQIAPDLGNSSAVNHNLSTLSSFSAPQSFSHPPEGTNSLRGSGLGSDQTERNNNGGGGSGGTNVVRTSRKRPRASRRAPTTVLTTDTTNFRAMVQEFTGIPAPPFTSSSSPFPRNTRFDLFGSAATATAAAAAQPYLLRPFAQKPPFLSPSPPSNFLAGNLQTPVFDGHFHNMFQSNPKLTSKPQASSSSTLEILQNDQNLKMGIFEEFGLSTQGLQQAGEALPATTTDNDDNNNRNPPPARWVAGEGGESDQQALNLRSGNGNSNGKLIRYGGGGTASSSEFLGDKAAGNVTTARSEGMVEPWICSSD